MPVQGNIDSRQVTIKPKDLTNLTTNSGSYLIH
jgi:hypothetical protein